MTVLGFVAIGRNEGERLKACLRSLPADAPVVYVDSGSTDGSAEWARGEGAAVVELDAATPFSAARARNEGFARLLAEHPDAEFVHFIDGDCVLLPEWIDKAIERLGADARLAAVAGQRMERYPEASWYNTLCAIEWDTPVGEAAAVGGDAIYRVAAFREAGGFDPAMMAGEEPELCFRLRRKGHRVERIDAQMTLHDAAITDFGSWWKRAVRSGYAYALGAMKHGRAGYNVREVVRALVWGAAIPLLAVGLALLGKGWAAAVLLALYPLKWVRLRRRFAGGIDRPGRYALFMILTNIAEVFGVARALAETLRGERRILEYKGPAGAAGPGTGSS